MGPFLLEQVDNALSLNNGSNWQTCRGYNIGIRLIDEFLAKSKITKCVDFRDSAEKLAKVEALPQRVHLTIQSVKASHH